VTVKRVVTVVAAVIVVLLVAGVARLHQSYLPTHGKGGVGIFDNRNYVLTTSAFNEMQCGGKPWRGKARSEAEMVSCNGSIVSAFTFADLFDGSLVVRFTPTRIQGYDTARWTGGYYLRPTR
jgi:hypothetical protein